MYDMTDVTVLMLFRCDVPERINNIQTVIDYLGRCIKTNISVMEVSENPTVGFWQSNVKHIWLFDNDPVFFKTKWMNMLIKSVNTPIIMLYEVDCIVEPEQLYQAVEFIRQNKADVVHPFGNARDIHGGMIYTTALWRERIKNGGNLTIIDKSEFENPNENIRNAYVMGGIVVLNTDIYRKAGCENENMYGWGPDDCEKIERLKILGYRYTRIPGNAYHMHHTRNIYNGLDPKNSMIYKNNLAELHRISRMTKSELENQITLWWWK